MKIRIKGGRLLYLYGAAPAQKGDRFQARYQKPSKGCTFEDKDGVRSFSCSRGSLAADLTIRTFVFDPEIHQVEGRR